MWGYTRRRHEPPPPRVGAGHRRGAGRGRAPRRAARRSVVRRPDRRPAGAVEQLTDELEALEEQSDILAEDYVTAVDEKNQLDAEVAAAEQQVAEQGGRGRGAARRAAEVAVQAYMGAGTNGLGPMFTDSTAFTDDLQRDQLSRVALSAGTATTDEFDQAVADLKSEQRRPRGRPATQAADKAEQVEQAKAGHRRAEGRVREARAEAEAELGRLIQEEEERRARESYERMQREAEEAAARQAAAAAAGQAQAPAQQPPAARPAAVAAAVAAQQRRPRVAAAPAGRPARRSRRRRHGPGTAVNAAHEPARHAVPLRLRRARRGLRLLRPHVVGVGPGRRVAAAPVAGPVRQRAAHPDRGGPAGRPAVLLLADQPRQHLPRRRPARPRAQQRHRRHGRRRSTGATSSASAAPAEPSPAAGRVAPAPTTVAGVLEGLDLQTGRPLAGGQRRRRRRPVRGRR